MPGLETRFNSNADRSRPSIGIGTRLFMTIALGFFVVAGIGIALEMGRDLQSAAAVRTWRATPCTVIQSAVQTRTSSSSGGYRLLVRFAYQIDGKSYQSDRYEFKPTTNSSYSKLQQVAARYPAGARFTCYVNPTAPGDAVLILPNAWAVLGLLYPLVFILIGAGGIWLAWTKLGPATQATAVTGAAAASPLAVTSRRATPQGGLYFFFGIFLLAGSAGFYFMGILPVYRLLASQNWIATPCTIVSSRVQSHSGSKGGSTYSVDILYEYRVAGQSYRSDRYNFISSSSSGYEGKAAIVRAHPAGGESNCFVNPADPNAAVLNRDFSADYLLGLIPLIFVAVGAAGIVWAARQRRLAAERAGGAITAGLGSSRTGWMPGGRSGAMARGAAMGFTGGPATLHPSQPPLVKLVIIILIALFWNGITSVFVDQAFLGWRQGGGIGIHWFLSVSMIPFVLVGMVLIGAVVYTFLQLFSPRLRLTLSALPLAPGAAAQLDWQIIGRSGALRRLEIGLEGCEEADYWDRSGNNNTKRTVKQVFSWVPVADLAAGAIMSRGSAVLAIPPDAMHSFKAPHNRIVWRIKVKGDIPRWPDLAEDYVIDVLPPGAAGGAA